jgi:enoyl-CoA hydratase
MAWVKVAKEGAVATVTIDRPDALNALNEEVLAEFEKIITELDADREVLVVVVTGEGKAFVAGADIAAMADMDAAQARAFAENGQRVFLALERAHFITIAAVNGFALGGGMELALACDMRFASAKAKMGQPEVSLGVTPGFGGTQRLPKLVGPGAAMHLLTTGDQIDGARALELGVVNGVFEPAELLPKVKELAETIAKKGPTSLAMVKKAAHEGLTLTVEEGCKLEAELFAKCFEGGEGNEGMKAFLEKRAPKW